MKRVVALVSLLVGCAHAAPLATANPVVESQQQLLASAQRAQQEGDSLRAQQYLLAALQRGADQKRVLPWLLRLYVADGQYRSAIERVHEGLRLRDDDLELRLLLASLYRATELETLAAQQYEEVLQRAPSQARAHFELAMMLHESGSDAARADRHFRAFLALAPDGPEALAARTRLLKEMP